MDSSLLIVIAVAAAVVGIVIGARFAGRDRAREHTAGHGSDPVDPTTVVGPTTVPVVDAAATAAAVRAAVDEALVHVQATLANERARTGEHLDHKKDLIDGSLTELRSQLSDLSRSVSDIERNRQRSFGELSEQLRAQTEGVAALTATTQQLREALANVKVRGQWGERMADDVLRLAGMIEGINYRKQTAVTSVDGAAGIPDYTFFMPNQRLLHMDVKFPIDNYLRYLEAGSELEQRASRDAFVKDVRARVKELVGRGYLDHDDTLDCLLLFIPNESVFGFVNEHDPGLVEHAMRDRIVICSPLTLYAVLAVVRQAVENFALERRAKEVLALLGQFEQQWTKYTDKLDKVQRAFATVHKDYDDLMTTRTRALQRPLDRITELRGDTLNLVDDDRLALEA
jgi:DNA recombination protein RmuC